MKWFKKHLNLTYLLVFACCGLVFCVANPESSNIVLKYLGVVGFILYYLLTGWILRQKGQSLWWLILSPLLFAPLWLVNGKEWELAKHKEEK